jgi:hypothetical protein
LNASLAPNTRKVYESGLREFKGFCKAYRLKSIWPPNVGGLVQFISHLSLRGCAYKTVKTYLAGISFHCKISGMEDTTKSFVVNKLVEGLGRSTASQDARKPVTIDVLIKLTRVLRQVCSSRFEEILFNAIFITAFFGFFRVNELVANSHSDMGHALSSEDVCILGKGVEVLLKHSKTD